MKYRNVDSEYVTIDKQKDYKTKPQKPLQDDNKQKDCNSDQKKQIYTDLPVPEHKKKRQVQNSRNFYHKQQSKT